MFNFYEMLLCCIGGREEVPATAKYSAAIILNKMLFDKDIEDVG